MLWNSIYEFFVKKIFGGYWHGSLTAGEVGMFEIVGDSSSAYSNTGKIKFDIFNGTITLGNYLSLIATIISITIILVLCCLFIYRLILVVGRLFMGA